METAPVLLIDDEMSFLCYARRALEDRGWPCATAVHAEEALRFLESNRCDVVVSDIVMPGNEDLSFLRRLVGDPHGFELILVTGHPSLETCLAAQQLEIADYLVKPLGLDDLCEAVGRALARTRRRARVRAALRETEEALDSAEGALTRLGHGLEALRELELGATLAKPSWPDPLNLRPRTTRLAELPEDLTRRERDVLEQIAAGYRVPTVARRLGISPHTVRNHLKRLFSKLRVTSQVELIERIKPEREE